MDVVYKRARFQFSCPNEFVSLVQNERSLVINMLIFLGNPKSVFHISLHFVHICGVSLNEQLAKAQCFKRTILYNWSITSSVIRFLLLHVDFSSSPSQVALAKHLMVLLPPR